jgi:hypothetical protein
MITPNSTVRFLNVPFSPSQNNLLKFASETDQENYMLSRQVYSISGCQYIREGDGEYLKVEKVVDALYNCNYVMFQNSQFGSKWFYAFIEKLKYVNGKVSHVVLKMDVYQTFQFNYTLAESFIDRQSFNTDYYNTLADTPSTGDLRVIWEYEKLINGMYVILFNSDPTTADSATSASYAKLYYPTIGQYSMPCYMVACSTGSEMSEIVLAVSAKGRADRIQACYFAPCLLDATDYASMQMPKGDLDITNTYLNLIHNMTVDKLNDTITLNINLTPTFKKELSYPYAKLEVVDRITGKYIELDLSKFQNPLAPQFMIMYNITDNVEYKIVPLLYNGIDYSIENSLVINPSSDLPIFSNTYAKYTRDNQGANIINGVMSTMGAIGSIATGNVAGAVGSFGSIASIINADHVARQQPNQVTGIKGDAFEYLNYTPSVYFRVKIMDSDHMKIARNFWNAYGYPERKIGTFNNTSNRYNFIKTVGANIIADTIPSEYLRELENIYDNGVTIWNNNYLNYEIL